jgi:hypothetical protein
MDRNRYLSSLAEKVELAYQEWHTHPKDISYQQKYEIAKTQLDNELKHFKDASYQKNHH